jgi:hypothetical protein
VVGVILGARVPFVLRKHQGGDGYGDAGSWCLLGDAYVHGIMDGEAPLGGKSEPEEVEAEVGALRRQPDVSRTCDASLHGTFGITGTLTSSSRPIGQSRNRDQPALPRIWVWTTNRTTLRDPVRN